ncbi:hypothetical protein Sfr7A_29515 [Streptomyces xinghaiensis]|uniref:Phage baseplate protein n=1 Tax=Streptomyces xinghaiensis TaxID=1038928 RepID=A0A3M8ETG5_9ACTN|nr:hypothetical protein Sfr7A_29515 [Streptomyces xinghaiensis]RKM94142.1 hypothetical protein SFRA_020090 [Streptomyces xinghaiensis]RNC69319.1 hypothetical protein DC095_030090 [Streptomyces xinghaiensis]
MHPPGTAELLAVWEAGLAQHGPGRALLLHRTARPGTGTGELLAMPVGERETDLFALRSALFGERMEVRIECRACGAAMEFDLDAGRLPGEPPRPGGPLRVAEDGWVVEFRLPTVADLAAVARAAADGGTAPDPGSGGEGGVRGAPDGSAAAEGSADSAGPAAPARRMLLARCIVSAVRNGEPVPGDRLPDALPERVRRRIAEAAERADPAAEVTLHVTCPECGEATTAELDIASYLWTELDSWARDLLLDVHLLATAYGWSEPEILALSPLRRRYYLELCADG